MIDATTLALTIQLPAAPSGWFDYDFPVLFDGTLALVRDNRDILNQYAAWRERGRAVPRPDLSGARLRISTFDGRVEADAIEVSVDDWSMVDRLVDGRWLVVATRAEPLEANARLFEADGTPAGAFVMGDAINHIRCAADGTIWASYFDEGIFADPNPDGSQAVSSSGIAQFATDGKVLFDFNNGLGEHSIVKCYALALDGNAAWSCNYSGFPIVRVSNGAIVRWRNDVTGALALAVEGDHVMLAGGYRDRPNHIDLLRLGDGIAEPIGTWCFPMMKRPTANRLQGRGTTMHLVAEGQWRKISVGALRESLQADPGA